MDLFAAEQDPQLLNALDPLDGGRCTRYRLDRPADISSLLELWSETLEQLLPAGDHPPLGQRLGPSSPLLDQSDTEIWERLEEQPRPAAGAGQSPRAGRQLTSRQAEGEERVRDLE